MVGSAGSGSSTDALSAQVFDITNAWRVAQGAGHCHGKRCRQGRCYYSGDMAQRIISAILHLTENPVSTDTICTHRNPGAHGERTSPPGSQSQRHGRLDQFLWPPLQHPIFKQLSGCRHRTRRKLRHLLDTVLYRPLSRRQIRHNLPGNQAICYNRRKRGILTVPSCAGCFITIEFSRACDTRPSADQPVYGDMKLYD